MPDLQLPTSLSDDSRGVFLTLLDAPSPATADLRAIVERYQALDSGALHDALYASAQAMIDLLEEGVEPTAHARIQAAIRYLVIEDDGQHDLSSSGLEDDALILNAVARSIDKAELCVALP